MAKKVVLGFSGGLDTSYCVCWLLDNGYDPICVTLDIGQGAQMDEVRENAAKLGVRDLRVIDGRATFCDLFLKPALMANALYQGVYPLATALSRPFIGKVLVDIAREVGTNLIAHGCTGKGNDQVRIEMSVRSLLPDAELIDPIRDFNLNREEEIEFLEKRGLRLGFTLEKPFSVDQNIWGRSVCAGILEDASTEPPESVFEWTVGIDAAPAEGEVVAIEFRGGVPVMFNGDSLPFHEIISRLNVIAGRHGIGRIDHIEDRLVGIKSRELYEAPGAIALIRAHQALEALTLSRASLEFKQKIESDYARLIYLGDWFSAHNIDILAYLTSNQSNVTGSVRLRLKRGNIVITGRESNNSLYRLDLATYGRGSTFDQVAGAAFSKLLSLGSNIQAKAQYLDWSKATHALESSSGSKKSKHPRSKLRGI